MALNVQELQARQASERSLGNHADLVADQLQDLQTRETQENRGPDRGHRVEA
jgi:hypothetical protein